MPRRSAVICLVAVLLFGNLQAARCAPTPALVDGNTAFALDLYGQLRTTPGNLFFSPYSIWTALAMTYAGARGDTQKQMAQVMHFAGTGPQLHSSFAELHRQLATASEQGGIELNVANALWAQRGHLFLPDFLAAAKDQYHANVNRADFQTGAEAARGEINRWVAQNTKDKIQEILPAGSLTDLTRLVLANAIYFKGAWARKYDKADTLDQLGRFAEPGK